MPATFKLKDGLRNLGVERPFGVNAEGVDSFECLRLLCGTIDLEDKSNGRVWKQRHCFLIEEKRRLKRSTIREIIGRAFDGDLSDGDVRLFLQKSRPTNRIFWENLKGELSLALYSRTAGNFVEAFLHTYRLYEMASVAMPLFYASAEHDYKKALKFLKKLPENPRDGDLAILRKFSETVALEGGYRGHMISVNFARGEIAWDQEFERQIGDYVMPGLNSSMVDRARSVVDVDFEEFPSFFVTFRNRLFHNTLSEGNLNIDRLNGASRVCEPVVDPALNWFTLMLCVILKHSASRYV